MRNLITNIQSRSFSQFQKSLVVAIAGRALLRRCSRCLYSLMPLHLKSTGPTAVGKSSVAAELCRKWKGEIISVDSVQVRLTNRVGGCFRRVYILPSIKVYKELNIGSAKPTEAEQAAVKHHLIDLMDCKDTMRCDIQGGPTVGCMTFFIHFAAPGILPAWQRRLSTLSWQGTRSPF